MSALAGATSAEILDRSAASSGRRSVRIWLLLVAALVYAMVLVGGATRLTGSGLSITEWQPILGVIPPTSEAGWEEAFAKYREIPEYALINKGMSLDAFKTLYWWEWAHRLLGRLVGAIFLFPFIYFLVRGSIPKPFVSRIAALFLLGGAQGALGWFMVKSGLSERVDVSQYRLAAHLALAVGIAAYAFWLALSIGGGERRARKAGHLLGVGCACLAGLVYLQIVMGALVAGLKAGYASNTWPLMAGYFVPPGLDALSPWYMNLFENPLAAQFVHRMLGYAAAVLAIFLLAFAARAPSAVQLRAPAFALTLAIALQIALGVATVVYGVPLGFALAHQANGVLVFALALLLLHKATVGFDLPIPSQPDAKKVWEAR